jgi:hypothetical protein
MSLPHFKAEVQTSELSYDVLFDSEVAIVLSEY